MRTEATLSWGSATLLVVANMIGSGVFTTSGFALEALGSRPLVLLAWGAAALIALLGVHCYATLARLFPGDGGEVHYVSETLHPRLGAALGWLSLWAGFAAPIAVCALTLEAYLTSSMAVSWPAGTVAAAAIILLAVPQLLRLSLGVWAQNGAVVVLVVLLVSAIVGGALAVAPLATFADAPDLPSATAFLTSVAWISFAFSGWNATTYVSGRVRDAERNVPRALFTGTVLVTVLYLAFNAVLLYAAPPRQLAGKAEVAVVAARALWGEGVGVVVTVTVSVALATSITSMLMAGAGVARRMWHSGFLPGGARVDPIGPLPVLMQVGFALIVVSVADLREALGLLAFLLGIGTTTTVLGLMVHLRQSRATAPAMWGYPALPMLFVVATAATTLAVAQQNPWLVGAASAGLLGSFGAMAWARQRGT